MIVPYMSLDGLFCFCFLVCTTRGEVRNHARRIAAANLIACACFVLVPLRMDRWPVAPAQAGIYAPLFRWLCLVDSPYNLAPSLHVTQALLMWLVFRRHGPRVVRMGLSGWLLLSAISTVFTWQHRVPDVITGCLLGVVCWHLFPDRQAALPDRMPITPLASSSTLGTSV